MIEVPTLVGRYPPKLPGVTAPGSEGARPGESLKDVAQGFEAVFLRQMLSAASAADFGGEDLFGSSGEDTFREMRDARFAEIASKSGTIGLASQIEAQLARHLEPEAVTSAGPVAISLASPAAISVASPDAGIT